jgi:Leucine-rich repeat (LRR) protein
LSASCFGQADSLFTNYKSAFQNKERVKFISIQCAFDNAQPTDGCYEIPDSIYYFTNLERLSISETRIKGLPISINKLHRLKSLDLGYNRAVNFNIELCKLVGIDSLEHLSLWMNNFEMLPECISKIRTLRSIDISFNDKLDFQRNIELLSVLPQLNSINMSGNSSRVIPGNIIKLAGLTEIKLGYMREFDYKTSFQRLSVLNIVGLDIAHSSVSELPATIAHLIKLKYIDISDNFFDSIPNELLKNTSLEEIQCIGNNHNFTLVQKQISKLKKLRIINLAHNSNLDGYETIRNLAVLPNLRELDLSGCKVKALPEELSTFSKLTRLNFEQNQDVDFKELFIKASKIATLNYLDIGDNKLAKLPAEIALLKNLKYLDLRQNPIRQLPSELYQLKNLKALNLYGTQLTNAQKEELTRMLPNCKIVYEFSFTMN